MALILSSVPVRCAWVGDEPLCSRYHDSEWGVPVHDERLLFEMITLEGAQAGLSWRTILKKREGYRRLFANFDLESVARFDESDVARLLADPGIVRNRLKVESTISNARAAIALRQSSGGLDEFLWGFVGGEPIRNRWADISQVPAQTAVSGQISRELKKRGFRFVGSTIVYAFMQATGMVNDHTVDCFRHALLSEGGR